MLGAWARGWMAECCSQQLCLFLSPAAVPTPPHLHTAVPLYCRTVQAYLAFGDVAYLRMFAEVYAAAMAHLQLDPSWNGNVWWVCWRGGAAWLQQATGAARRVTLPWPQPLAYTSN